MLSKLWVFANNAPLEPLLMGQCAYYSKIMALVIHTIIMMLQITKLLKKIVFKVAT